MCCLCLTVFLCCPFLLQRGGSVSYFGPLGVHSRALVDYLEAVPGFCSARVHGLLCAGCALCNWLLGEAATLLDDACSIL